MKKHMPFTAVTFYKKSILLQDFLTKSYEYNGTVSTSSSSGNTVNSFTSHVKYTVVVVSINCKMKCQYTVQCADHS